MPVGYLDLIVFADNPTSFPPFHTSQ